MVKVVLLDRDGLINVERPGYVKTPGELDVFPFATAALERLRSAGYLLYVVSNQSGVGRGLMTGADLKEVTAKLVSAAGPFDGIYYCIHKPDDGCDCRKPRPGLLRRALADAEARGPITEAWMIGDTERDIKAAAPVGCRTILVKSGSGIPADPGDLETPPDHVARDLAGAVEIILAGG